MWYILVGVCALILGIWLGRNYFRPTKSFQERENKMLDEARHKTEEKVQAMMDANEVRIVQLKNQNDDALKTLQNSLKNEIQLAKSQADNELSNFRHQNNLKKLAIEAELSALLAQKQENEKILERLRDEVSNYEKSVTQSKIRIIKRVKAERELELQNLTAYYDKLVQDTAEAVQLIQNKLSEWSNMERAAYEERMGREESENRNKLSLASRSINELRELYNACEKLHLSNPTPLYKAIYELYLRGPVKDLGVKLGATGQCGIYKLTNIVNGKVYVGQSVDIAERWKQHIKRGCRCDAGTLAGAGLYEAMWEDGVWNFSFQILEVCERPQLNAHEKQWIEYFQSNEIGYNKKL